ncbi:MAG: Crp/Fnr family transcriptional regulator [Bacteroidota bacterium]
MNLHAFLREKNFFTEEECDTIEGAFTKATIPKGEVIVRFNQFSGRVLFIEKGLLRIFYLQDGKDITHFFFNENNFIAPINSILGRGAERYQWEALEACEVSIIPYDEFWKLEERFPRLSRLVMEFAFHMLDLFSEKLNILQFQSAAERYSYFLEMYPELTNRISLGSTASFLGITQQTLSVIRGKKK